MSVSRRRMLTLAAAGVAAAAIDAGGVGRAAMAAANLFSSGTPLPKAGAGTTLSSTVLPGAPDDKGYRKLVEGPGEKHLVREDITSLRAQKLEPLVAFGHLSDLHVIDDQSPSRVEFLDRYNDKPETGWPFSAAYRPYEFLSLHLVDAMCRSLKELGKGPRTDLPLAFTVVTGDAVDNAQLNETRWYIDLLDGGKSVQANSGSPDKDESVSNGVFGKDVHYWRPEEGAQPGNKYNERGFGQISGLLGAAPQVLHLRRPGHALVRGLRQPRRDGSGQPAHRHRPALLPLAQVPHRPRVQVVRGAGTPGQDGRLGSLRRDQGRLRRRGGRGRHGGPGPPPAHARGVHRGAPRTAGLPVGHGFSAGSDKAYYAIPAEDGDPIRYITLDSTNPGGLTNIQNNADGGIDEDQFDWLEERLKEYSHTTSTPTATPSRRTA